MSQSIVIVGAGVFGAAAALELCTRGWDVTVVDRGTVPHPDASSTDVSKMVRMDYGSDLFYHELAEAALQGWERWNSEWPRPLYHGEGFLVLSTGSMRPGGFEYESHRVLRHRGYDPERVGGVALERRYPKWNGSAYPDGYLSRRGGWAESEAVVGRLAELARAAGVTFIAGGVAGLVERGARVVGVRLGPHSGPSAAARESEPERPLQTLDADLVLVCAGAWTPKLAPATSALLTPVAQPVLYLGVDDPEAFRAPTFLPFAADIAGSGWYGFPALDDGRVKLGHHGPGRTVDPDDPGAVADDHVRRARAFLADAIPSLADVPVVGTRVCMYCDTPDGDLLVDHDPDREGLVVAAGGSGHGFKFAPVMGGIIADAVERRESPWLHRFRWRSPRAGRAEEARFRKNKGSDR